MYSYTSCRHERNIYSEMYRLFSFASTKFLTKRTHIVAKFGLPRNIFDI